MAFRTLMIGDIVGKPGRMALEGLLKDLVAAESIDLVIVNGENTAGGSGITPQIFQQLRAIGVDVVTMGDHCYRKRESLPLYETEPRIIRPANLPDVAAGHGYTIIENKNGVRVAVINLLGRTFLKPVDCPFRAVDAALEEIGDKTKLIFVDMHAEATSDKIALGWYLDGRVTAVAGTHTHIQTADERLLHQGTAYISDLGMTGPYDGVLGRDKFRVIKFLTTGMPTFFDVASGDLHVCGALITADETTGRASSIRRINMQYKPEAGAASYDASDGKGEAQEEI